MTERSIKKTLAITPLIALVSLCSAQEMRVPVGNVYAQSPGSVTLLRPSGAKMVKVPCKLGTPIYADDVLQLGNCPDLAIKQQNGVTQEFKDHTRHRLLRVESADEQASERLLAQYTRVMARPRGQTILDRAAQPTLLFAANIDKPTAVTVSQAGVNPHRFLLAKDSQGRYSNAQLENWLRKMQDPDEEISFTLTRPDIPSQPQEDFKIMSRKEENQIGKIDDPDLVTCSLHLAVFFAQHRLYTLAAIYRKSAEMALTPR